MMTNHDIKDVVAQLKRLATKKTLDGMARYGLPSDNAFGVSVGDIQRLGKQLGRSHELAEALWKTGHYEARMLAAFVDEIERVTPTQMDRWCKDFDNWGTTDTACFALFDRSPHAWKMVGKWVKQEGEFQKRAGFVLIACLAQHDKTAKDAAFVKFLPMIEKGANDHRNFVKKGVSWALRGIGHRSRAMHAAAIKTANRLAKSENATARWIGRDALKDITRPAVIKKVKSRDRFTSRPR